MYLSSQRWTSVHSTSLCCAQLTDVRGRFALLRRARLQPQKATPNAATVPIAARRSRSVESGEGQLGQVDEAVEKSSAVPRS